MNDFQWYLEEAFKELERSEREQKQAKEEYDIGEEIRKLIVSTRSEMGMTQKELAEKSGVSQANISRMENGNYHPSLAVLKRIADAFGKKLVVDFVDYKEEEQEN